ncbi:MAG: hypothetical protein PHV36_15335 [Elusimicrobiales bacterium]|nr:hypothetical protein [Elusimicrobiales bacterium]
MKIFLAAALLALAFSVEACKKKAPENIPQPKVEPQAAAVSTAAAAANPLEAPGAYLKTTVGQIDNAKAAAALYEKAAKAEAAAADLNNTGGN